MNCRVIVGLKVSVFLFVCLLFEKLPLLTWGELSKLGRCSSLAGREVRGNRSFIMLCGGGNSLHFFMKYLVGLETTISSRVISTEDLGDDIRLFSLDFCMQWLLRLSLYHSDQHNPKLLKMPPFSDPPAAPKADTPSTWGHSCPLPSHT